jgi:hypothetical protein
MKQILTVLILAGFALNVSAETIVCETAIGNVLTLKYDKRTAPYKVVSLTSHEKVEATEPMGPITDLTKKVGQLGYPSGGISFTIGQFPEPGWNMEVKMAYNGYSYRATTPGGPSRDYVDFVDCKATKDNLDQGVKKPVPGAY